MTIKAIGALFFTNGFMLDVEHSHQDNFNTNTKVSGIPQTMLQCKLEIKKGQINITIENIDDNEQWTNIQSICRASIEGFLALHLLKVGTGLIYVLTSYEKSDGSVVNFPVDTCVEQTPLIINEGKLISAMAQNLRLRDIFRDYNAGLIDRANLPIFLFREAEEIAKAVRNYDGYMNLPEILPALTDIGVPQGDIDAFKAMAQSIIHPTRHGLNPYFNVTNTFDMARVARHFLTQAIKFLIKDVIIDPAPPT